MTLFREREKCLPLVCPIHCRIDGIHVIVIAEYIAIINAFAEPVVAIQFSTGEQTGCHASSEIRLNDAGI